MTNEDRNLDRLFAEKLGNFSPNPPEYLWNKIELQLDSTVQRKRIGVLRAVGIAASFLIISLAGWFLTRSSISDKEFLAQNTISQKQNTILPSGSQDSLKESSTVNKPKDPVRSKPATVYSMASFAANLSPVHSHSVQSAGEEPVNVDFKNDLISSLHSQGKLLKKFSELFSQNTTTEKTEIPVNNSYSTESGTAKSEPNGKEKNKMSHWQLGVEASPVVIWGIHSLAGQSTKMENTFSAGVTAGYKLNNRFTLRSGVSLNQMDQITKSKSSALENTALGKLNIKGSPTELRQELSYIEIPVSVNYRIVSRKFKLGVNAGIHTDFLTKNKASAKDLPGNNLNGETENLRQTALAGTVGLEMGYSLGKGVTITIEPRVSHFFTSLSSDPSLNFRPYQMGIYTGVTYSFQ